MVKEGGADVIKLEGAGRMLSRVRAIAESNIGVMGHIGLTPQSATKLGVAATLVLATEPATLPASASWPGLLPR